MRPRSDSSSSEDSEPVLNFLPLRENIDAISKATMKWRLAIGSAEKEKILAKVSALMVELENFKKDMLWALQYAKEDLEEAEGILLHTKEPWVLPKPKQLNLKSTPNVIVAPIPKVTGEFFSKPSSNISDESWESVDFSQSSSDSNDKDREKKDISAHRALNTFTPESGPTGKGRLMPGEIFDIDLDESSPPASPPSPSSSL